MSGSVLRYLAKFLMRRQKVHDDNIEKDNINGEEETDINIFFTQ